MLSNFQMNRSIACYYQHQAATLRNEIAAFNRADLKMPQYKEAFAEAKSQVIKDAKKYLLLSFQERNAI